MVTRLEKLHSRFTRFLMADNSILAIKTTLICVLTGQNHYNPLFLAPTDITCTQERVMTDFLAVDAIQSPHPVGMNRSVEMDAHEYGAFRRNVTV